MGLKWDLDEEQYRKITHWLRRTHRREVCFRFFYYFLPVLVMLIYGLAVFAALLERQIPLELLAGPAVVFIGVTLFRKKINALRPYTVHKYHPMVSKAKDGESFPSRHTVSASAIAVSFFFQSRLVFCLMVCLSLLIAVSRVLAGVHFVRDVVWGAVIGYGCTFILTLLIHFYF